MPPASAFRARSNSAASPSRVLLQVRTGPSERISSRIQNPHPACVLSLPQNRWLLKQDTNKNLQSLLSLRHGKLPKCTELTCRKPVYSRGLCRAHYARWRKGKYLTDFPPEEVGQRELLVPPAPYSPPVSPTVGCETKDCSRPHYSRGFCKNHYISRALGEAATEEERCSEPDCWLAHYAKGLCRTHYRKWKGGTFTPKQNPKLVQARPGGKGAPRWRQTRSQETAG